MKNKTFYCVISKDTMTLPLTLPTLKRELTHYKYSFEDREAIKKLIEDRNISPENNNTNYIPKVRPIMKRQNAIYLWETSRR